MALTFGVATTDRVEIAAAASINDLAAVTGIAWVFPTTLTSLRRIIAKGSGAPVGWRFALNGTSGFLEVVWRRATTNDTAISNTLGIPIGSWSCVAFTADQIVAPKIYVGSLTRPLTEAGYSTSTFGSGTYNSDAALVLDVGNHSNNNSVFQGSIEIAAVWNRALLLGELRDQWEATRVRMSQINDGCVAFYQLGNAGGGGQPDLSGHGNNGTVVGATVGVRMPGLLPRRPRLKQVTAVTGWGPLLGPGRNRRVVA